MRPSPLSRSRNVTSQIMKEGSLEAPTRHPVAWRDAEFHNQESLDEEMRRVFDVCHGCRRCFSLCGSFPRLFDLIDSSRTGELDSVDSKGFEPVVEACTLCDMCFMTKCPYVPPHPFNIDFPHLMLRARASGLRKAGGKPPFTVGQLAQVDRNARLIRWIAPLVNWITDVRHRSLRRLLQAVAGIHARAILPVLARRTAVQEGFRQSQKGAFPVARDARATGRKAAIFATCYVNYYQTEAARAARKVLALQGVETELVYPGCCGMPHLEHGNIEQVVRQAGKVSKELMQWIERDYDIITLTASCGLMLKSEWPLLLPEDEQIASLAKSCRDIDEYIVDIARNEGLCEGMRPIEGGSIAVHMACHARAQNVGPKAAEMLRLIPDAKVSVIERCSGHGGTFGMLTKTHDIAMKVGKPTARAIEKTEAAYLVSDCPLAAKHLMQELEERGNGELPLSSYPITLLEKSYGLEDNQSRG